MKKYFTIVIHAEDEMAARSLIPGAKIGPNTITACSLGDALTLNDKIKELIHEEMFDRLEALESEDLAPFLARKSGPVG